MPRRITVVSALVAAVGVVAARGAEAAMPDNANCWGVVTSQRAVAAGDIGTHAAAQDEPRSGLGNVARAVLGEDASVGDLGAALGNLDELSETHCP